MSGDDALLSTFSGLPFNAQNLTFLKPFMSFCGHLPPGRIHVCWNAGPTEAKNIKGSS